MNGVEHLILSMFDDVFFSVLGLAIAWVLASTMSLPLPGTRAYQRNKEVRDKRHSLHMALLNEKEDQTLERRLALSSGADRPGNLD